MKRYSAAVILLLTIASTVRGQTPATKPSTRSAIVATSDTPTGTLILLARATQSGETDAVSDLFDAKSPDEQKLAAVLLKRAVVYAKFRKAAAKAFGEEVAAQLTGSSDADSAIVEQRIAESDVKIEQDKATIQVKGDPQPAQLLKVGGKWKLSMADLTQGMQPGEIAGGLERLGVLCDVVNEMTDEISAGKFKNADEVNDAIRGKLATAMMQKSATTQPAPMPMP